MTTGWTDASGKRRSAPTRSRVSRRRSRQRRMSRAGERVEVCVVGKAWFIVVFQLTSIGVCLEEFEDFKEW